MLTALSLLLVSGAVLAQAGANDPTFNTVDVGFGYGSGAFGGGSVEAIALQTDGRILIGGGFTAYNDTALNGIARLDANGHVDTSFDPGAGPSGGFLSVIAIYPLNAGPGLAGKILVGGSLTQYDGTARNGIVRLNTDGSLDNAFDPGTGANGAVHAIVLQADGKILIGGLFNGYDGTPRNGIARLNVDGSLDTSFDPGTGVANDWGGSLVSTIALYPPEAGPGLAGKVMIGGGFTEYNGTVRNYIARLNADGSLDNDFDAGEEMAYGVSSIVLQPDGQVLAGGNSNLARLNTDGSVDPSFTVSGWFSVEAIALQPDGKVLIGSNGSPGRYVRRLHPDGSADAIVDVFAGLSTWVRTLALQPDGRVLIGGNFGYVDGVFARGIARLDTSFNVDLGFNPGTGADDHVEAIVLQADGKVLMGGAFTRYNGTPNRCIARLNENGSLDPSFTSSGLQGEGPFPSLGLGVHSIVVYPDTDLALAGKIIVAGYFSNHDGIPRNGIARLNTDGSLDIGFDPGTGAMNNTENGTIRAVALYSADAGPDLAGKILVVGTFTEFNGVPRSGLARLNGDGSLDGGFDPGTGVVIDWDESGVRAIAIYPPAAGSGLAGKIIIGGKFTEYDGTPRNYIARLNADGSLDTGFDPGIGTVGGNYAGVHAIAIYPPDAGQGLAGKILIGGSFTEYDGTPRNGVARLNVDGSLDLDFESGAGTNGPVLSVAVQEADGKILIGGQFSSYDGIPRNAIARLNVDGNLDTSFDPGTGADGPLVSAIALRPDGRTLIGGQFLSYNGTGRNRIARLLGGNDDCTGTAGGTALPGTPCDDGDPCTVNDTWDLSCTCVGEILTNGITLTPFDTLCVTNDPYLLDHATPTGGTWSGPGVENNMFTPPMEGSFTLTYSVADPCPTAIQATIEAIAAPTVEVISGTPGGCNLEPVVFSAQPSGGTWEGSINADGMMDQSCAVRPTAASGSYTYNAPNGDCSVSAFGLTFLDACLSPPPMGSDTVLCSNDDYMFSWSYMGGGNVNWTITGADSSITSGPGGSITWYFSPYQKAPGIYTIAGRSSSSFPGSCPGLDTLFVTVFDPPVISIDTHGPVCSNDAPIPLTGSPAGGTWSGMGVSGEQFDPAVAGPGSWTLTYTATQGNCTSSDSTIVVVDAAPNAGADASWNICSNQAPILLLNVLLGTPQAGGTWSGPSSTSGVYDPSTMEPGAYTYTVSGSGACADASATVFVNEYQAPSAGISNSLTLCSNSAPIDMRLALAGFPDPNGTWSGPSPTSGFFDPANMLPGVYSYTVSGNVACPAAGATLSISVVMAPNAGVGGSVESCADSPPFTLFSHLGGNPQSGGFWTFSGQPSSGIFLPGTSPAGIYTYTVTGIAPCSAVSSSLVVDVIELQLDAIDGPTIIDEVEPLSFSALPFLADADSFSWSKPEDWVWVTIDTTLSTVELLPPAQAGSDTICVTAYGGVCEGNTVCLVTELSVGIMGDAEEHTWFTVHPNPSEGIFQLTPQGSHGGRTEILVHDALGQLVAGPLVLTDQQPYTLRLEDRSSGLYFMRVVRGGEVKVMELLIQR